VSLYLVVEGDGEVGALPALVERLKQHLGLAVPFIPRAGGVMRYQLHLDVPRGHSEVERICELCRSRGPSAVLVTQDSEDACPRNAAPQVAGWIRALALPFPVAVVLFYREYETLFLAASQTLQGSRLGGHVGRPGLPVGAVYRGDPEIVRNAKGWISEQLPRRYSPMLDQEAFTRTLDLGDPGLATLSSYRRLCNALRFLASHTESPQPGLVYP